jgi:hypothetical protein
MKRTKTSDRDLRHNIITPHQTTPAEQDNLKTPSSITRYTKRNNASTLDPPKKILYIHTHTRTQTQTPLSTSYTKAQRLTPPNTTTAYTKKTPTPQHQEKMHMQQTPPILPNTLLPPPETKTYNNSNYKSPTAQSDQHYTTTHPPSPPSPANHTAREPNGPAQVPTTSSRLLWPT